MPPTPLLAPQLPLHPPSLRYGPAAFGVGGVGLPPAPPPVPFAHPAPPPGPVAFGFGFGGGGSTGPPAPPRAEWRAAKRTRDDDDDDNNGGAEPIDEDMDEPKRRRAHRRPAPSIDLGRALAALDRPALLALLHGLIADDEAIAARVYTRLPTPSLESASAQLDAAEAQLRSVLPAAGTAREQYVWSRARAPLAELASAMAGLIPLFVASAAREPVHPATTFAFLHMVTLRTLHLERLLPPGEPALRGRTLADMVPRRAAPDSPDALASMMFPALVREWEHWLAAIDAAVNYEGRIFGHDVVAAWMRGLAALGAAHDAAVPVEGAMRAVLGALGARLHAALGWLVGMRTPT